MSDTTKDLIDHELISRANTRLATAAGRLRTASDDLDTAKTALARAERAASQSPNLENEIALEQAQRAARVAEKAHEIAKDAHSAVSAWVPKARGAAHSGLYVAGLRARVAAAAKADDARVILAQAEADMRAAVSMCHEAILAGHPDIRSLNSRPITIAVTSAEEKAAIQAEGIDLETGVYGWLDFAKSQEPKEMQS